MERLALERETTVVTKAAEPEAEHPPDAGVSTTSLSSVPAIDSGCGPRDSAGANEARKVAMRMEVDDDDI